jgi:hypothetical protein
MVAGDTYESQIVFYYDPLNSLMSAHKVTAEGQVQPPCERNSYKASAFPAVVPDRNMLYVDDYRDSHDWLIVL